MKNTYLLDRFGFLSITGRDAIKFFQGYCTSDLNQLKDTQLLPGATCNIQGRMVANFLVKLMPDGILIRLDRDLVETLKDYLKKYIVFSKAQLSDVSDQFLCYGLLASQECGPTEQYQFTDHNGQGDDIVIRLSADKPINPDQIRFERWCALSESVTQSEALPETLPETLSDLGPWLTAEIAEGWAWVDAQSSEEYLPQMFNLHSLGGIDLDKGCYLGQEIVARMHFRGKLKKTLHYCSTNRTTSLGEEIFTQNKKSVGKVVASAGLNFLAVIQTKTSDDGQYILDDLRSITSKVLNH